jgi:hypothetical protein
MPPPKRIKVADLIGVINSEGRQLYFRATGAYEVAARRTLYTVTCFDAPDEDTRNLVWLGGSRSFPISLKDHDKNRVAVEELNDHLCRLIQQKALEK